MIDAFLKITSCNPTELNGICKAYGLHSGALAAPFLHKGDGVMVSMKFKDYLEIVFFSLFNKVTVALEMDGSSIYLTAVPSPRFDVNISVHCPSTAKTVVRIRAIPNLNSRSSSQA